MIRHVAFILIFGMLSGCFQSDLSKRIGEQARTQGKVDLATVTDFEWDTVSIFSPYQTNNSICESVGTNWPDCKNAAPNQVSESNFHLVFINKGSFVTQAIHSRKNGNFCKQTCALRISKTNAIFRVVPFPYSSQNATAFYLFPNAQP